MRSPLAARAVRAAATAAVAGLVGGAVLTAAAAAPAAAVPSAAATTVTLAGAVSPAAPDADTVQTVTIPLTVTNTSSDTLYDLTVSSLRSAPITSRADLTTAFRGDTIDESDATKPGPRQSVPGTLAPGASARVDYVVDTSDERGKGICLCFLGVYALDVVVTAADDPAGRTATVGRTQTYLPSLLGVRAPAGVGWLWPLLDRPHRLTTGSVFADDDLARSVAAGGRLDRALQVVEQVDAATAATPDAGRSLLLLLDPDLLDELATMTHGYTVQAADGTSTTGAGGPAAAAWLARLAAVLPHHDVRTTLPADPDVVGLAARSVTPHRALDDDARARVATALQLPAGDLPPSDLAWPVESELDAGGLAALTGTGAAGVVTGADTDDDGAVTRAAGTGTTGAGVPMLLADPTLSAAARAATATGGDTAAALQRLVVAAALTSVRHADDSRYVLVVPDRDADVAPAAAARAVLATLALGTPLSPVAALATAGTTDTRTDLLHDRSSDPPAPLDAALAAAGRAATAAATVRGTVVGDADTVIGDLLPRVQRTVSNSWAGDTAAGGAVADLDARAAALTNAVQVVVRTSGSYSLASADAPLLLTVSNSLPRAVRIRLDATAGGRSHGFTARAVEADVAAGSRQTIRLPASVTRSGRFDVTVTLQTASGAPIGAPAHITVTSTAVGKVGEVVTYGAAALLVLALVVRGVRRWATRSRAGSDGTGPDDATARPDDARTEGHPTVPASPS